jgi:DNA replication protein DnaC
MNNYYEEICSYCKKLLLSTNLAERALTVERASHQEFLSRLLAAEIEHRGKTRISKLINTAGFPRLYDFTQFKAVEVELQDTTMEELQNLSFYEHRKNILLYGGTGIGKTMLSICIGVEACKKGIARTAGLINQFSEYKNRGMLSTLKKKLKQGKDYYTG